jgi:tetratricopeptide (TPR) repeat protein
MRGWLKGLQGVVFGVCLLPALASGQAALEAMGCGGLGKQPGGYGPYDFRVDKDKLYVVEYHHFDAGVETFTREKNGYFGGDIDYTLRAFPNHHRALMAMINLGLRERANQPRGARYTVQCWLMRAEAFRPDDEMVKVIHGIYHLKHGRSKEAVEKLEQARGMGSQDANVHYNLGLAYLDLNQYDKALESAHAAYAMGFPLPGLRDRLQRAGRWRAAAP